MLAPRHTAHLTDAVAAREQEYLDLLAHLVDIDSGSLDHDDVRRMTAVVESVLVADGFAVQRMPVGELDVLVARRAGEGPTVLLNAHLDTVFAGGTAARRPFRIVDGRALGPGVADDKCGIAAAIIAARALRDIDSTPDLLLVLTPDEELGSPRSAALLTSLAGQADVALCLEAARASGDVVSARKGGANVIIDIVGRAAHAGVEPEKGIDASVQMARTILDLNGLNDPARGITVTVGVARAGERSNVVPARASLWVDVRAITTTDFTEVLAAIERLAGVPHVEGITVQTTREAHAPPMEATPAVRALADLAVATAAELGISLAHVSTGGIGDANQIARAGIPVLDGLAPIGGDDHTPTEWLEVGSIVPRVTLLARLVQRISQEGVPTP